jgi:DNA-binding transcriptional LysR family regulator
MQIEQLRLFVDVFHAGGFAPVARARDLAPSSVARAIAALEESVGERLFQRTTRRHAPTAAGERLMARIEPVLAELDAALDGVGAGGAPSGRLRVTASTAFGERVLAPRLAAFRVANPRVTVDLVLSDAALDLVGERIDLAIRHGALPDGSMVARRLAAVSYRLVASPDYIARHGAPASPADLARHETIAFPYPGFSTEWRLDCGRETVVQPIEPAVVISNAGAILAAVRSGLGIGLLADWTIGRDFAEGRLVEVLPGWRGPEGQLSLVFPSRRFVPARARAFADFLVAEAKGGFAPS